MGTEKSRKERKTNRCMVNLQSYMTMGETRSPNELCVVDSLLVIFLRIFLFSFPLLCYYCRTCYHTSISVRIANRRPSEYEPVSGQTREGNTPEIPYIYYNCIWKMLPKKRCIPPALKDCNFPSSFEQVNWSHSLFPGRNPLMPAFKRPRDMTFWKALAHVGICLTTLKERKRERGGDGSDGSMTLEWASDGAPKRFANQ